MDFAIIKWILWFYQILHENVGKAIALWFLPKNYGFIKFCLKMFALWFYQYLFENVCKAIALWFLPKNVFSSNFA